jgi:hypothetical protein
MGSRTLFLSGGAIALIGLYFIEPSPATTPPCPTRALLGFDCPGCGSLRAIHNILHLRFSMAFHLNPLATLLFPAMPILMLFPRRDDVRSWPSAHPRFHFVLCILSAFVLLGFWVLRFFVRL